MLGNDFRDVQAKFLNSKRFLTADQAPGLKQPVNPSSDPGEILVDWRFEMAGHMEMVILGRARKFGSSLDIGDTTLWSGLDLRLQNFCVFIKAWWIIAGPWHDQNFVCKD